MGGIGRLSAFQLRLLIHALMQNADDAHRLFFLNKKQKMGSVRNRRYPGLI